MRARCVLKLTCFACISAIDALSFTFFLSTSALRSCSSCVRRFCWPSQNCNALPQMDRIWEGSYLQKQNIMSGRTGSKAKAKAKAFISADGVTPKEQSCCVRERKAHKTARLRLRVANRMSCTSQIPTRAGPGKETSNARCHTRRSKSLRLKILSQTLAKRIRNKSSTSKKSSISKKRNASKHSRRPL